MRGSKAKALRRRAREATTGQPERRLVTEATKVERGAVLATRQRNAEGTTRRVYRDLKHGVVS